MSGDLWLVSSEVGPDPSFGPTQLTWNEKPLLRKGPIETRPTTPTYNCQNGPLALYPAQQGRFAQFMILEHTLYIFVPI